MRIIWLFYKRVFSFAYRTIAVIFEIIIVAFYHKWKHASLKGFFVYCIHIWDDVKAPLHKKILKKNLYLQRAVIIPVFLLDKHVKNYFKFKWLFIKIGDILIDGTQ